MIFHIFMKNNKCINLMRKFYEKLFSWQWINYFSHLNLLLQKIHVTNKCIIKLNFDTMFSKKKKMSKKLCWLKNSNINQLSFEATYLLFPLSGCVFFWVNNYLLSLKKSCEAKLGASQLWGIFNRYCENSSNPNWQIQTLLRQMNLSNYELV